MFNWVRVGALVAVVVAIFFAGDRQGSNRVQAQWVKADNLALKQHILLRQQAESERDLLNEQVFELQTFLDYEELKAEGFENALQIAIAAERLVQTVVLPAPDGCPAVQCAVLDSRRHFRLWNCAINNSCETLPPADETASNPMPGAGTSSLVAGGYGLIRLDHAF